MTDSTTRPEPPAVGATALGQARYHLDKAQRELVLYSGDREMYRDAGFAALTAVDQAGEALHTVRRALAAELQHDGTT